VHLADATTTVPTQLAILAIILGPTVALLAVLVTAATSWRSLRWLRRQEGAAEVRWRRGQALDMVRWAAEMATDPREEKGLVGIAMLEELTNQEPQLKLLVQSDLPFVSAVLRGLVRAQGIR
jgi:hypothetical protein